MRNYLIAMRTSVGLTQDEFAKRIGISPGYCCEIERGTRQPDMAYSMMKKIANALDVPVQEIIDADKEHKATVEKTAKK